MDLTNYNEVKVERDRYRALYHYYRKAEGQNEFDRSRMDLAKEKLDELNKICEQLLYKQKIEKFLEENPQYTERLSGMLNS